MWQRIRAFSFYVPRSPRNKGRLFFPCLVRAVVRPRLKMEINHLAQILVALGCPADKSAEMAAQLDKRARQLATEKGRSYEEALKHLLTLMKQGWAAPK
jgi:hypothetical protein